jgi:hypothetical protein
MWDIDDCVDVGALWENNVRDPRNFVTVRRVLEDC